MFSIRIDLKKTSDERAFMDFDRRLALEEEKYYKEQRRKKRAAIHMAYLGVCFLILIGIIVFAILDSLKYRRYQEVLLVLEEIKHRPVVSASNPVIDRSVWDEIERQKEEEEAARRALMYSASDAAEMISIRDDVLSEYAIVVDINKDEVIATRQGKIRISPASMTKILTILVAYENIEESQLDDIFEVTPEINYYSYKHDCSAAGFADNELVPVRDLFYGTILPSGADAALSLATYVAGSQEAFVELMNQKLETLGISDTAHFTNCIGLYDEEHYCTAYDMAMILHAAVDNEFCKEVLSTKIYTTTPTEQHPKGIELSNWFLRRIEDKPCGGDVLCAKTGYVSQAGNCSASYASDGNGNDYIVVTANAPGNWKCIYDHVRIYRQLFPDYDESQVDAAKEKQESEKENDN